MSLIIEERVAQWTWIEVYECDDLDYAIEVVNVLMEKHQDKDYRILKVV